MSITLNFELNDQDLAHFQAAAESSRKAAEGKSEQEIIDCAVALLADNETPEPEPRPDPTVRPPW